MILITEDKNCTGCSACAEICPTGAITMESNSEGFLYAKVNTPQCVNCGKCEAVCPVIKLRPPTKPTNVYGAKSRDKHSMMKSSSGGIFTLLARDIISRGGIVFGARLNSQWEVVHSRAQTEGEIEPLRTSKYVQSRLGTTFSHIKGELRAGREVLFCGTPCQASALDLFVGKKLRPQLTIVDFICHGVPSPEVWSRYLDEVMMKHGGKEQIKEIMFRDKSDGWRDFNFIIRNKDGKEIIKERAHTNKYVQGFLSGLYMRPSCHHCPTKNMSSGSDFTIADFWGVRRVLPDFYDYNGVSLVIAHNSDANKILHNIDAQLCPTTYGEAIARNPGANNTAKIHPKREQFFKLWRDKGVIKTMKSLNRLPIHKQIIRFFWRKE